MSLVFTPPKEEAKQYRYASYVVGSGLKVHNGIGPAKNSLRNRGWNYVATEEVAGTYHDGSPRYKRKYVTAHGFILENVDGTWYVLYEIKPGLTEEELPWMKEYLVGTWQNSLYSEYHKTNKYYQDKIADGSYKVVKKATPMSTDEYVEWRLAVERERLGVDA